MTKGVSLAVGCPAVAAEWHPTRNGALTPKDVAVQSGRRVWWRCPTGHEWEARIQNRSLGRGCPYCAGTLASPERNLAVLHPELMGEWHPTRNGDWRPEMLLPGSERRVWWRCRAQHEWEARPADRARGQGCPYCAGRRPTPERNLAVCYPDVAAEWHPTRNGQLIPAEVLPQSNRRVWWRCPAGHEWVARVQSRTGRGTGCPVCAGQSPTAERNLAVVHPELAAEWHPSGNGNLSPAAVLPRSNRRVWWRCGRGHEWQARIQSRALGGGCPYCAGRRPSDDHNLAVCASALAGEWHPERNADLTVHDVTPRSGRRVWWRCSAGHEWQASVVSRAKGAGCPVCAGKHATAERNLAVLDPQLASQWHPTRNGTLRPRDVLPASGVKVWWRCRAGHEWRTGVDERVRRGTGCPACADPRKKGIPLSIAAPGLLDEWWTEMNGPADDVAAGSHLRVWWRCRIDHRHCWRTRVQSRSRNRSGCPYCAGKRPTPERNLAAVYPDLAAQWHPTRNGDLSPTDVLPHATRPVWWHCPMGHEWQAQVNNRTRERGCPYCAGKYATPERNLAVVHPELAAQWHPTRNGELRPEDVTPGAKRLVWWRCPAGHDWQAAPGRRILGTSCPDCFAKRPTAERNLAVLYPHLAAQWHPTRNGDLRPEDVTPGNGTNIWWHCPAGHEWTAPPDRRVAGDGCPYCAGKRPTPERNLAVVHPHLAAQWHPTRNGQLRPQQVTPGSGKKVWWRCPAGHDWEAVVYSRTTAGTGCPLCAGSAQVLDRWMAKRGILALGEHQSNVILVPGAEPAATGQRPQARQVGP